VSQVQRVAARRIEQLGGEKERLEYERKMQEKRSMQQEGLEFGSGFVDGPARSRMEGAFDGADDLSSVTTCDELHSIASRMQANSHFASCHTVAADMGGAAVGPGIGGRQCKVRTVAELNWPERQRLAATAGLRPERFSGDRSSISSTLTVGGVECAVESQSFTCKAREDVLWSTLHSLGLGAPSAQGSDEHTVSISGSNEYTSTSDAVDADESDTHNSTVEADSIEVHGSNTRSGMDGIVERGDRRAQPRTALGIVDV
jgi:hypothetical protein